MTSQRRRIAGSRISGSRISGPDELLQAVPYLLGFHPAHSLVLVGLAAGRLVVTARLDLDEVLPGGGPRAVEAMVRGGSSAFVALVYDDAVAGRDERGGLPWARLAASVSRDIEDAGADPLDVLLVGRGRWWSFGCTDEYCCPPAGRELSDTASTFAAAATFAGVVALPDRATLEAVLDPLPDDDRADLEPAIAAAENAAVQQALAGRPRRFEQSVKRALFKAARAADQPGWIAAPDQLAGEFGAGLAVTAVRDAVWLALDDRRIDGRPLWRDLARRLPSPYDAPPLFLYGWAAWRVGDGASAGMAAERAIGSDPAYRAADLLLGAVHAGLDPRRMPRLRQPKRVSPGTG